METIKKFFIDPELRKTTVEMPVKAEILSLAFEHNEITLWAKVKKEPEDDFEVVEDRDFEVFETGDELHQDMGIERNYIGTVRDSLGTAHHVFERIN